MDGDIGALEEPQPLPLLMLLILNAARPLQLLLVLLPFLKEK
jgi:hypothetical protein